jgi:hypothetical protein
MDDRNMSEQDTTLDPEDVNSPPSSVGAVDDSRRVEAAAANEASDARDANDEVPVPIAMSPAEVDERAQAVEALRDTSAPRLPDSDLSA